MAPILSLAGHLEYLVSAPEDPADRDKRLLDEWARYDATGSSADFILRRTDRTRAERRVGHSIRSAEGIPKYFRSAFTSTVASCYSGETRTGAPPCIPSDSYFFSAGQRYDI
ncbi:hypothetical protein LXA43DRAFT_660711 [Ganoderma leucocontextum]|nr:hypothetical protein LXA43DRAFT_660711 [Ganoderma leucocontextum]